MKQLALTLIAITGCSSDAEIGISSQPATCLDSNVATASGNVRSDIDGETYPFADVGASMVGSNPDFPGFMVFLGNNQMRLSLGFCGVSRPGGEQLGDHEVEGVQRQRSCPSSIVNASMVGSVLEFRDAEDGLVIVDEVENCFAGRYAVDFGENGSVSGMFSVGWTQ
ncbi:MAG TPA: hypothetical protein VIU61_30425 [Kofleriaceae bacterium]